ncbi:MAG: hypothetical protein NVS3B20_14590 [Polyangiales bacterium]
MSARAEEALTPVTFAGTYRVVEDTLTLSGFWIDSVIVRSDGTYDAVFGSDVSNLSGHQLPVHGGTYALRRFTAGASIVFFRPGTSDGFTYVQNADGTLTLRHLSSDRAAQTRFTLRRVHR